MFLVLSLAWSLILAEWGQDCHPLACTLRRPLPCHPMALWMWASVPDSCYCCPLSGHWGQMEAQRCWAGGIPGRRPALWALNAHPTTASGPQNYCHPSGVHRGKQLPHRPMPCVTERGVLFSATPGLAVLLQGDLTLSSAVVRTERRCEGQKRMNHQLHKSQEHMLFMRALL